MYEPYILVSDPAQYHYTEQWDSHGVTVTRQQGCHALFAAHVPFIPRFLSQDFTRAGAGRHFDRIGLIINRQKRFINDLVNTHQFSHGDVAFNLRFIARPSANHTEPGGVKVIFMGKVFHRNKHKAYERCQQLWRKFMSHYPMEDPFNYPLEGLSKSEFHASVTPFSLEHIQPSQLYEIRKFEDVDPLWEIRGSRTATPTAPQHAIPPGYFPHPFHPALDATALSRFIHTLSQQRQTCIVSICLQPTALLHEELLVVNQLLSAYQRRYEDTEEHTWVRSYRKERYDDMKRTFYPLINQRNHLFKMTIQIIGEQAPPIDVVEALGSELIKNDVDEPRLWSCEYPSSAADLAIARANFTLLEHQPWGQPAFGATLSRIRFLVSSHEAVGAFRLPIPPESGYLPGMIVRDEPFVLTSTISENEYQPGNHHTPQHVEIGEIMHRGQPTGQPFTIPVNELTRHGLVAGATGAGKTNTCLWLLSQIWKQYQIPFLVIYPIDKRDYRILMADPAIRDALHIYTVGDANVAPFRFNPFLVADGMLVRTHMSLLLRCFGAAFDMWHPLPAIYREALRRVYRECGWDVEHGRGGDSGTQMPTLAHFAATLEQVTEHMTSGYAREVQSNIRQASVIRIHDLLHSLGMIINVEASDSFVQLLKYPTVMELGRVGSTEDIALLMGLILMHLSEELQSRATHTSFRSADMNLHITLVEEAHRLMLAGVKGGEDFSNLLAEIRGFGGGILIAEQIPSNLVSGALGNTFLKIMHWLEDQRSFSLFCDIMNLDERQREYARMLAQGYAIVRDRAARPIHVRIHNYLDQFQNAVDEPYEDLSDRAVHTFMQAKIPANVTQPVQEYPHVHQYCQDQLCQSIRELPQEDLELALHGPIEAIYAAAREHDWNRVATICLEQLAVYALPQNLASARCYLARVTHLSWVNHPSSGTSFYEAFPYFREALIHFPSNEQQLNESQPEQR